MIDATDAARHGAARHLVTRFDAAAPVVPHGYEGHARGYGRAAHVDRAAGAVHTGLGTCRLAAGGTVDPHVHSYEELAYVIEGNPVLTIDGEPVVLSPDDCAFVPVGSTHAVHNPGPGPARWIDLQIAPGPAARRPARHLLGRRRGAHGRRARSTCAIRGRAATRAGRTTSTTSTG